jgi:AhpD family alkylhydroperoxidase
MTNKQSSMSNDFQLFMSEAPQYAQVWMTAVQGLESTSALDKKTEELTYLAVLAATRMGSGISFHIQSAKRAGASRKEVINAILVGLPAVGHGVTQVPPAVLASYDTEL